MENLNNPAGYEAFNKEFFQQQVLVHIAGGVQYIHQHTENVSNFKIDFHSFEKHPNPKLDSYYSFFTHVSLDYTYDFENKKTTKRRYFFIQSWNGRHGREMYPECTVEEARYTEQFYDCVPTHEGWVKISPEAAQEIAMIESAVANIRYDNDGIHSTHNRGDTWFDNNPIVEKQGGWDKNRPRNTTMLRTPVNMVFIHRCNETGRFVAIEKQNVNYNNAHSMIKLGDYEIPHLAPLLMEEDLY